mgnify:CR=1 FL=1
MLTHRLLHGLYAVAISVALWPFCLVVRRRKTSSRNWKTLSLNKTMGTPRPRQHAGHEEERRTKSASKLMLATRKPRVETMRQSSTKDTVTTVVRCRMTRHTPASRCMASRTRCTGSLVLIQYSGKGPGTSWLPDATPHFGVHATFGEWQTMYHALFNLVYDHQGGPRGGDKTFVNGMLHGNGTATARGWDFWFASDARA